jgi:YfiH family protein
MRDLAFLAPAWGRGGTVRVCSTTRRGGLGVGQQATFSLGPRADSDPDVLAGNRRRLREALTLASEPVWLRQVHGTGVVDASLAGESSPQADAAWTNRPGIVCAVLTADCLPVVIADPAGAAVAVAHAGWRGLAAGVIEATVAALPMDAGRLQAWLGPAIGPRAFEVGPEVRSAFVDRDPAAVDAFRQGDGDRWWADLYRLARQRLLSLGVNRVSGGGHCTRNQPRDFFSRRRDGPGTGRMATLVWIAPST